MPRFRSLSTLVLAIAAFSLLRQDAFSIPAASTSAAAAASGVGISDLKVGTGSPTKKGDYLTVHCEVAIADFFRRKLDS